MAPKEVGRSHPNTFIGNTFVVSCQIDVPLRFSSFVVCMRQEREDAILLKGGFDTRECDQKHWISRRIGRRGSSWGPDGERHLGEFVFWFCTSDIEKDGSSRKQFVEFLSI